MTVHDSCIYWSHWQGVGKLFNYNRLWLMEFYSHIDWSGLYSWIELQLILIVVPWCSHLI